VTATYRGKPFPLEFGTHPVDGGTLTIAPTPGSASHHMHISFAATSAKAPSVTTPEQVDAALGKDSAFGEVAKWYIKDADARKGSLLYELCDGSRVEIKTAGGDASSGTLFDPPEPVALTLASFNEAVDRMLTKRAEPLDPPKPKAWLTLADIATRLPGTEANADVPKAMDDAWEMLTPPKTRWTLAELDLVPRAELAAATEALARSHDRISELEAERDALRERSKKRQHDLLNELHAAEDVARKVCEAVLGKPIMSVAVNAKTVKAVLAVASGWQAASARRGEALQASEDEKGSGLLMMAPMTRTGR